MMVRFSFPTRETRRFWLIATFGGFLAGGSTGFAADVLELPRLEPASRGAYYQQRFAPEGSYQLGLHGEGGRLPLDRSLLVPSSVENGENEVIEGEVRRLSTYFGYAVAETTALSLGIHGTQESLSPSGRDQLMGRGKARSGAPWRENLKRSAFSGATVTAKHRFWDQSGFRLSGALFGESGTQTGAEGAVTRSAGPGGGAVISVGYGFEPFVLWTFSGGYRYRGRQELGALVIGDELFYRSAVLAGLGAGVSAFVAGGGRRVAIEGTRERQAYEEALGSTRDGAHLSAGLEGRLSSVTVSFEAGRRLGRVLSKRSGSLFASASVQYEVGDVGYAGERSYAAEIRDEQDRETAKAKVDQKDQKGKKAQKASYDEMEINDLDPVEYLKDQDETGSTDDVETVREKIKRQESELEPRMQKIEAELERLEKKEKRDAAREAKRQKLLREKRRREARERAKEERERMREYMRDAESEVSRWRGVTHEQMNWNGLESE